MGSSSSSNGQQQQQQQQHMLTLLEATDGSTHSSWRQPNNSLPRHWFLLCIALHS